MPHYVLLAVIDKKIAHITIKAPKQISQLYPLEKNCK